MLEFLDPKRYDIGGLWGLDCIMSKMPEELSQPYVQRRSIDKPQVQIKGRLPCVTLDL